jgi:hypothetical protein
MLITGRDPRALEGEEGTRQQQVQTAERQTEGEPEQRDRDKPGRAGAEAAVLIDQPYDGRGEDHQEGRGGNQHQVDLADADRQRAAHAARVAARRHPAQRRKEDGRDRNAEDALGQHVDAEGLVDRAWRARVDEPAEGRVDQLVEVDDAEPDRHRQHQHEDLADSRVMPVDVEGEAEVDLRER